MQVKKTRCELFRKKNYSSLQNIKYQNITRHDSLFFSLQNNNKNRRGRKGRKIEKWTVGHTHNIMIIHT